MIESLILASGGFWAPIANPLSGVLAYFYSLIPNYGVAIFMLTVAMMILLTPLTIKQTRSMLVMQKLQPEMKKLQEQHKNDRQALNEAVMALYKEHNASPLGGCLPMLLPFPLFIALLKVLEGLSRLEKHGKTSIAAPKYLSSHTQMFKDIVKAGGKLDAFGMDLARSARTAGGGFAHSLPYFVLLVIMVGTQFYQQYQLTSKNPAIKSQPGQAMMMKFIPLFFGLISIQFPAGVVLYWTVSNVIRIGQQWALYRYDPKVKALVMKDVKEIEAKTREIDARDRPWGRARLRGLLAGASPNDKGQDGKDAVKPAGRAPGDRTGAPGRGRTPPGKATGSTPGAMSQKPGTDKGAGAQKAGGARPGGANAKPGAAGPGSGAPKGVGTGSGTRSRPGTGGTAGSAKATSGGTPKAAAPKPGAARPAASKAPPAKPGNTKSGAPRPPTARPNTSRTGAPSAGATSAGASKAVRPKTVVAKAVPADTASPPSGADIGADLTNGTNGANAGVKGSGKPAATNGASGKGLDAATDEGMDAVPGNGTAAPTKGRTGGSSARNVSNRRRRGGK